MRQCHLQLVTFTYLCCVGFNISPTVGANFEKTPSLFKIAQVNSSDTTSFSNLKIGDEGENVKLLQTQLKKLGYYNGIIDGQFDTTTRNAVTQFQREKALLPDGIVGSQTRKIIETEIAKQPTVIATPTPEVVSEATQIKSSSSGLIRISLIAMGILTGAGILFYIIKRLRYSRQLNNAETYVDDDTQISEQSQHELANSNQEKSQEDRDLVKPSHKLESTNESQKYLSGDSFDDVSSKITSSQKLLPPGKTSFLAKVNVVDELILELESSNPTKRSKAIWELGQKGDSRAIQPLVEQMVDSDSQQRSLILAALSEIGTRTLKPMNRALAVSLQDDSADVRKNAIRDLTRVYDMMAQISQMLSMAMEDEDPEVQETAKYAISQMNRIRILPSEERETPIKYPQEWQNTDN